MADDQTDLNAPAAAPDSPSGRVYYPVPVQQPPDTLGASGTVAPSNAPAAAPDSPSGRVYYPVNTPQSQPTAPQPGSYEDPNTPLPAIWNKPKEVSWDDFILGHLSRPFQGTQQAAENAARIFSDTYTLGQGSRVLSGQLTGPELERQRALVDAAKNQQGYGLAGPVINYGSQALAYAVPGPGDLGLAGRVTGKALPYFNEAISAARNLPMEASPFISKVAARATGQGTWAGLLSGLQDIGHGVYDPLQVGGDVAIGTTVGGASSALGDTLSVAASKFKDWWGGVPSGTPAEIKAVQPPGSPEAAHAEKFSEWQTNMKNTGEAPSPAEVRQHAVDTGYGTNTDNWPSPLVNIYNATQPKGLGPVGRLGVNALTAGGQTAAHLLGAPFMTDPVVASTIQLGGAGAGELFNQGLRAATPMRVTKAVTQAYPGMTGMRSTGAADPNAFSNAFRRLMLPESTPP